MQKEKFRVKPFSLTFLKESKQRTFVQNFVLQLCVGVEWLLKLNDNGAPVVKNLFCSVCKKKSLGSSPFHLLS